jgi:hypothetical protein
MIIEHFGGCHKISAADEIEDFVLRHYDGAAASNFSSIQRTNQKQSSGVNSEASGA